MKDNLLFAGVIFLAISVAVWFLLMMGFSKPPADIQPGDEIVVLSGITVLNEDGQPCQLNWAGFVSPTSPEGTQSWYKPSSWIFPTHQTISVIFSVDETTKWVASNLVVKPSPELLLCPSQ